MEIIIIKEPINLDQIKKMAENQFGDLVKITVDIEKKILALGGELHADQESQLLENGSEQSHLWGINIYPFNEKKYWIEFDSMVNIRPRDNNRSRYVEDKQIRQIIFEIIYSLIID